MRLGQVTQADLISWKDGLPGSATSGNRALAVLSGMMRHAELLGLQPVNRHAKLTHLGGL